MRKVIFILALLFAAVSCGKGGKGNAAVEVDSLRTAMVRQDSALNRVFESLGQVVSNLQVIKERENLIAANVAEGSDYSIRRISADIDAVDSLLLANRETITKLYGSVRELKDAKIFIASLEKLIEGLTAQLDMNDSQIVNLRRELADKNIQVKTLSGEVAGLEQRGEALESEVRQASNLLNIAYYVVDSQKELLRQEVIYKTGFVGRTLKVNENRSLDSFTTTDIRSFDHVQIDGDSPMLVSSHPDGSYQFSKDASGNLWLNILDKDNFWKYTKVLVVAYK